MCEGWGSRVSVGDAQELRLKTVSLRYMHLRASTAKQPAGVKIGSAVLVRFWCAVTMAFPEGPTHLNP